MTTQVSKSNSSSAQFLSFAALAIGLIALVFSVLLYLKKEKIVYVDSIKLVSGYNGAKLMKAEFEKKTGQWKLNLDSLSAELSQQIADYEKRAKTMSAREKQLSEELIESKREQFENYRNVISENMQKEDQRVTTQVLKEISDFLKKYGEEQDYELILGATSTGNIVYAKKERDVTEDVLQKLNSEYKPGKQ